MSEAQRHAAEPVTERLDEDWPLTRRQDDAPESRHTLSAHRLTNERKGFLADCQGQ